MHETAREVGVINEQGNEGISSVTTRHSSTTPKKEDSFPTENNSVLPVFLYD